MKKVLAISLIIAAFGIAGCWSLPGRDKCDRVGGTVMKNASYNSYQETIKKFGAANYGSPEAREFESEYREKYYTDRCEVKI